MLLTIEKELADISNVNFRKENHGKQHVLACDIRFSMVVPVKMLNDLALDTPPMAFADFFYDHLIEDNSDIEGGSISKKREYGISSIALNIELFEHEMALQWDGEHMPSLEFSRVKINNFTVEFQQNRMMKLSARCQFEAPNDDEVVGRLAEFIKEKAKLTITPPPQQDFIEQSLDEAKSVPFTETVEFANAMEKAIEYVKTLESITGERLARELNLHPEQVEDVLNQLEFFGVIGPQVSNEPREVIKNGE